ncbi:uncharacterized protein BDZ99DRAFT_561246 [Mytilinidion resinicola]|uniref:Heterokaryon incompatibility domain-containing protein n=1 Tax=Mytilinidion resinicola TaxID=574789 RepID=A0A6A6YQJ4_9PEZI|nr:uncharacterized protein BDZ99DRAFT_561246 [Mytilinidion resinicola]KAF2810803.1 hypothetical protein BDZ99DRAFT_561246 [Mytilinidion resinicola]
MSYKDIYTKVTKRFMDQGYIDILAYCQHPTGSECVPSWVPDWRSTICSPPIWKPVSNDPAFRTSGSSRLLQKVSHGVSDLLTLRGVRVDTVKEFGSVFGDTERRKRLQPKGTLQYLAEVRSFMAQSPRFNPGSEDIQTSRIAVADFSGYVKDLKTRAISSYAGFRHVLDGDTGHDGYLQNLDDSTKEVGSNRDYILNASKSFAALRLLRSVRPFISTSRYVGLAPVYVQAGDVICIILSGNVPYVLRKCGKAYILISKAYMHGIMYGEHMAGSPDVEDFTLK